MSYKIDVKKYAKPGEHVISDYRLAAVLHSREEDCTELLEVEINKSAYALRICGVLRIRDNKRDCELDREQVSKVIDELEKWELDSRYEVLSTPWFEWIENNGDPLAEICEEIELDSQKEIDYLRKAIQSITMEVA